MTLKDAIENFQKLSEKASDAARQLAFAGIAVIWIFRGESNGKLPPELLRPAALFVLALTLDLLHYSVASMIWWFIYRHEEKGEKAPEDKIYVSPTVNLPASLFFVGKILLVLGGYFFTFRFLWGRVI